MKEVMNRHEQGIKRLGLGGILILFTAVLYLLGTTGDTTNFTMLQIAFTLFVLGSAAIINGVSILLIPVEKYYNVPEQFGVVTIFIGVVYFNIWYPGNWHVGEEIGFPVTGIGLLIFLLGFTGLVIPFVIKIINDVENNDKTYYVGIGLLILSFLTALAGIILYAYTQTQLPFPISDSAWTYRSIGFGLLGFTPFTFFLAVTYVSPTTQKGKTIGTIAFICGAIVVYLLVTFLYPDNWHIGNALWTITGGLGFAATLLVLLLTSLNGVLNYEENVDLSMSYAREQLQ